MALRTFQTTVCWSGRGLNTDTRISYFALGAALPWEFRAPFSIVDRMEAIFSTERNFDSRRIHCISTRWICEAAENHKEFPFWLRQFTIELETNTNAKPNYMCEPKSVHFVRMWLKCLRRVSPIRWIQNRRPSTDIASEFVTRAPLVRLFLSTLHPEH